MNRRRFLGVFLGAIALAVPARVLAHHKPSHDHGPKPSPSPSPSPSPTPTPPPTDVVYGPHAGAQYIRDHAGPLPVIGP